jgi:hypothetical protein
MQLRDLASGAFLAVATLIATTWHALTKDGILPAAFRQGADEIGHALKAFPDSIQSPEMGQILSPTPGEIGMSRGAFGLNAEQENRAPLIDRVHAAASPDQGHAPDQGQNQDQDRPQGRGH